MEKIQERQRACQGMETSPETDSEGATVDEEDIAELLAESDSQILTAFPQEGAHVDTMEEHKVHACARMTQGAHAVQQEVSEDVRSVLPRGPEEKRTHCRRCGQFGHSEESLVCKY